MVFVFLVQFFQTLELRRKTALACCIHNKQHFALKLCKIDVNGENADPIFVYLKDQAPAEEYKGLKAKAAKALFKRISDSAKTESDIQWNFTKFLINKEGRVVARFAPTAEPKDFEQDILKLL